MYYSAQLPYFGRAFFGIAFFLGASLKTSYKRFFPIVFVDPVAP